jgi:EcsC protein family
MNQLATSFTQEDHQALMRAYEALEHPGLAARVSNFLGIPVTASLKLLPRPWSTALASASEAAVAKALDVALTSLGQKPPMTRPRNSSHRLLSMATGAAGGFFGLPALLVELPVTTIIMLRSIADVAQGEGEDLTELDARLACVNVLAFGGRSTEDTYTELGYYELRAALALHFSVVSRHVVARGGVNGHLPATVNLIRSIAARFGIIISEKAAVQMVPVLGAAAGAFVNNAFMEHFQNVAGGHFTVRRLERKYGCEVVEAAYRAIEAEQEPPCVSASAARATL